MVARHRRGITPRMAEPDRPDDLHDLRVRLRDLARDMLARDAGPLAVRLDGETTVILGVKRGPVKNVLERRRQLLLEIDEL